LTALQIGWMTFVRGIRARIVQVVLLGQAALTGLWLFLFSRIIWRLEGAASSTLMMPRGERPGLLLDGLLSGGRLSTILEDVAPEVVLTYLSMIGPLPAWASAVWLWTVPLVAIALSSESLAGDIQRRTLRFELHRVSRGHVLAGRFAASAFLCLASLVVCSLVVLVFSQTVMMGLSLGAVARGMLILFLPLTVLGAAAGAAGLSMASLAPSVGWTRLAVLLFLVVLGGAWFAMTEYLPSQLGPVHPFWWLGWALEGGWRSVGGLLGTLGWGVLLLIAASLRFERRSL